MYGRLVVLILVLGPIGITFACNGYKVNLVKMKNCAGPNAIITADPNFSLELNEKCELRPHGCLVHKSFSGGKGFFTLKKNSIVFLHQSIDICGLEHTNSRTVYTMGFKCPVKEGKYCVDDTKMDISKYKYMLEFFKGNMTLDVELVHDTGKSRYYIELALTKGA